MNPCARRDLKILSLSDARKRTLRATVVQTILITPRAQVQYLRTTDV